MANGNNGEDNGKRTNRQLIQLCQNEIKHIQWRLDRIEYMLWGVSAMIFAATLTVIGNVVLNNLS